MPMGPDFDRGGEELGNERAPIPRWIEDAAGCRHENVLLVVVKQ